MRCDSLQPTRTAALTDASHRSKALLLAHALFLLLCAWLSLSAVRGRLGGGASGAARARLDSDLQQPLLAALLDAGAAGGGKTPGGTLPAWLGAGGWEFPVPPEQLDRGVVSEGDPAAAARLARKLLSGQPISVAALGGSLTFGKGASSPGRTDWVSLLAAWLRDSFPTGSGNSSTAGRHVVVNAAVAASPSEYISFCLQQHLDPQHPPDLVLVDYSVNDGLRPWHDAHRLSLERLLRRLLALPSAPLVAGLMMHSYRPAQTNRTFHRSGEEKLGTLALYYGLPWLSMRSVVHHKLVAGEDGFLRDQWLADDTHPNDRGHTYVAQLVVRYLQRILAREAAAQLLHRRAANAGGGPLPAAVARGLRRLGMAREMRQGSPQAAQLPPPMLAGAEPLLAEACVQGSALQAAVVPGSMRGFEWEVGGRRAAREVHATTNSSGSELTLQLDTDVALAPGSGVAEANATHVALLLWYTHSRYKVGDGQATCSGGCACEPQLLRTALRRPYGTQDHLWLMLVTRSPTCRLTVRTLNTTETAGHVFRLRGVLVSAAAAVRIPTEFTLGENLDAELPVAV